MDIEPAAPEVALSAAKGSPLANIRIRRQEIQEAQWADYPVPRWNDPELYMRYKPVDHAVIENASNAVLAARRASSGSKASGKKVEVAKVTVDTNIDVLVAACVGIYARIDGVFYTLTDVDSWVPVAVDDETGAPVGDALLMGFSEELGSTLAEGDYATARKVVRAVYFEEGDILTAANHISDLSGYKGASIYDELLGE